MCIIYNIYIYNIIYKVYIYIKYIIYIYIKYIIYIYIYNIMNIYVYNIHYTIYRIGCYQKWSSANLRVLNWDLLPTSEALQQTRLISSAAARHKEPWHGSLAPSSSKNQRPPVKSKLGARWFLQAQDARGFQSCP